MVYTAPARSGFWKKLGPGGFASFALAACSVILLLGLPLVWRMVQVLRGAREDAPAPADGILVLGRKLQADQPSPVFVARLAHAESLWRAGLAPRLIVAGGLTGRASISEAEAGRAWLIEHGLPMEAVLIEDQSQHTLENLFLARETLRAKGWKTLLLVSDPLHLARATALAEGLGLTTRRAPALACPPARGGFAWWKRAAFEAFFLHWYRTGLLYSHLIGSERQLERVT
ncbi:MAG TPA: YdcF family protein [Holophagaceae bacterium]|jgi:uncharacterized SAM-binding protein YcdF (DUF218 family)|nr:YdcF family protein [Holophagaceae bacterium]